MGAPHNIGYALSNQRAVVELFTERHFKDRTYQSQEIYNWQDVSHSEHL